MRFIYACRVPVNLLMVLPLAFISGMVHAFVGPFVGFYMGFETVRFNIYRNRKDFWFWELMS